MKINYQRLYQNLGSLFYAIANADKHVRKSEEITLTEKINSIWVPLDNTRDEFGTDAAQYIFIVFDHLHAEGAEADAAFNKFSSYYNEHTASFDAAIKLKILQTAEAIAGAYSGRSIPESIYLKRLKHLMKI